jgi:hypothetical protein
MRVAPPVFPWKDFILFAEIVVAYIVAGTHFSKASAAMTVSKLDLQGVKELTWTARLDQSIHHVPTGLLHLPMEERGANPSAKLAEFKIRHEAHSFPIQVQLV